MPIVKVILDPAEPVHSSAQKVELSSLEEADRKLREWAWFIPEGMPGYHKTPFTVVWHDEATYQGRFDLTREHATQFNLIGGQMRAMVAWIRANPDQWVMPIDQVAQLAKRLDEEHL